ncbi:hypothetical protein Lalb_Chr10g0093881 [Lupinus albus]|uniref:Uncharacterized protein n=1 Tax=Lupinus albus TaxID=3870 RepID=A0A6A4PTW1_LUPAL|nr:hypothetical protein Lalb_Chr10g0093881 [Lupinus albus]
MSLVTLFGKLQEHKMGFKRLTLHEDSEKKKNGISLKATTSQSQEERYDEEDSHSDIDDETMSILVKNSASFSRRKKEYKRFQRK